MAAHVRATAQLTGLPEALPPRSRAKAGVKRKLGPAAFEPPPRRLLADKFQHGSLGASCAGSKLAPSGRPGLMRKRPNGLIHCEFNSQQSAVCHNNVNH